MEKERGRERKNVRVREREKFLPLEIHGYKMYTFGIYFNDVLFK